MFKKWFFNKYGRVIVVKFGLLLKFNWGFRFWCLLKGLWFLGRLLC